MASLVQFFIVAAGLVTIHGNNGPEDFFLTSHHNLLHEIQFNDLKIASVEARASDRLDIIELKQQQVLNKIHKTTLGFTGLDCMDNYEAQLKLYADAKNRLKFCYDEAKVAGNSLKDISTSFPKEIINYCDKYSGNQTQLDQCYIYYVDKVASLIHNDLNGIWFQVETILSDLKLITQTDVHCSFEEVENVVAGSARRPTDFDKCIQDVNGKNLDTNPSDAILSLNMET